MRRRYRGPYPAVLITLVFGVLLSVLGSWMVHAWEEERGEAVFAHAANTIARSIEDCFLHQIDNVRAVAALYEAFPKRIGRNEFRNFVDPLVARCEALLAVAWAPAVPRGERVAFEARARREHPGYAIVEYDGAGQLVPASERDLHFPIQRVEPPDAAGYPLGLDLASRPRERETIAHVRGTGRMSFVPHDATPDARGPTLETLLYPVYQGRRTASGTAGQDPAGIVVGVSRLTGIVDEALRHAGHPRLGVDIFEVLPNGERQAVYTRPPDRAARPRWSAVLPLTPAIDAREMPFVTADHPLVLRFVPHAGVYGTWPGWLPAAFLIAGLLFTGLVAVYIDHTRSKTERIAELARRLAEQDRRKNEFLAVLGHELRNPIAPIGNAVQVLRMRRTPTPATVEWAAGVIERQVSQLARLVDDLLDVARIARGDIALRSELVDLREVVARAIETQRPLIDAKGHLLRERLPPDPCRCAAIVRA